MLFHFLPEREKRCFIPFSSKSSFSLPSQSMSNLPVQAQFCYWNEESSSEEAAAWWLKMVRSWTRPNHSPVISAPQGAGGVTFDLKLRIHYIIRGFVGVWFDSSIPFYKQTEDTLSVWGLGLVFKVRTGFRLRTGVYKGPIKGCVCPLFPVSMRKLFKNKKKITTTLILTDRRTYCETETRRRERQRICLGPINRRRLGL